eukprot:TRINITY_DN445_c5_g1_i2.p1 TRINITY_DN445_c5_g1~~TRINITY_DN445_c5_g1_i2.p1  ORF type:complete len:227 (+),score=60.13 TRINITY_DN445_c5_g1_i2:116-796(+)
MMVQHLRTLIRIEDEGITEANFSQVIDFVFSVVGADGVEHPLCPGGLEKPVTFQNRLEYADLVANYKVNEYNTQLLALREGVRAALGEGVNFMTGEEMERIICGNPDFTVELLKKGSSIRCCPSIAEMFWKTIAEITPEERSLFLKFVWGRTRLPANFGTSESRFIFIMTEWHVDKPDTKLPAAHTCFFTIDLPKYSTQEIMKEKLLYAIRHCVSIDLDFMVHQEE